MNYRVKWEIDVEADSPLEAARQARKSQEPGTTALFFEVTDKSGQIVMIDLLDDGNNPTGGR